MAVENAEIVELPHVMVHDEVHRSMDEFLNNMQRQGISPEMYYQLTGSTEEDLHKQFEGEAEMRTRTNLVIEAMQLLKIFKQQKKKSMQKSKNYQKHTTCQSNKSNAC